MPNKLNYIGDAFQHISIDIIITDTTLLSKKCDYFKIFLAWNSHISTILPGKTCPNPQHLYM